jgi:hypothetical protein
MPYEAAARGASYHVPLSDEVAAYPANSCALQTSSGLRMYRGCDSKHSYRKHQCCDFHFRVPISSSGENRLSS